MAVNKPTSSSQSYNAALEQSLALNLKMKIRIDEPEKFSATASARMFMHVPSSSSPRMSIYEKDK